MSNSVLNISLYMVGKLCQDELVEKKVMFKAHLTSKKSEEQR